MPFSNQFRSSDEPDEVSELISLPSSSDRMIIQPATAAAVDRVVVQDERLDAVGRSGKANNNKNRSIVTVPSLPMDSRSQDKLRLGGESHPTPWHKNPLPAIHHGPILNIARPNSVTHTDSVKELQSPAARKLHSIRKLPSIMDDSVTPNTIGDDKTGTFPGLTPVNPFSNNSELKEPERTPIRVNRNFPINDQPHPTTPINSLKVTSEPIETSKSHSDHGQNACINATLPIVANKDHTIKCDSSEFDQLKTELKQLKNVISYLKFFGVILTLGLLIAIAFGAYFMNIHNNMIDSSRIGPEAIQTNSLAGGSVTYSKLSTSVANTLINADALSGTLQPANTNNLTVSGTPTIGILAGKASVNFKYDRPPAPIGSPTTLTLFKGQDSSDLNANGGHVSIQAGGSPTNSGSITLSIMTNGSTDASATRRRMLGNGSGNGGSSTSGASVTLDDGTILQPVHVVTISSDQTTGSSDVSVKANSASIVASQGHVTVGSEVGNAVISAISGSVQINAGQTIELFTNSTAPADTLPQAHPFDEDYMGELHVNIESVKHKNGHIHVGNSNCTKRHYIVHNAGKHLGLLKNGGGNGNGNSSGNGEGNGNSGCDPSDADVLVSEPDSDLYIMSVNNNVNIQGSLFLANGTIQANSLWIQNIYFTPTNQSLTNSTIDQVESVSLWSYLNSLSTSITLLQTNYSQSPLPIPGSCNITNLELQLSATQAVITVQGNEIANLQTVNTALVNSNQIQLNNITNLVSQLSILQTLTNQLINLTTTQSNEIDVLKNNLTFMNNALQSLANNVSSLSSNVNSLESNTNSQTASFTSFTNATNQQIGKLNNTIQDLQLMASTSNNSTLDVSWMNTVDSAVTNLTARMSANEISATLLGIRVTAFEANITNILTNHMMMDETIISNLTKQIDSNLTYENVIAQSLATLTNRVSNLENRTPINPSFFNSTRVTVISTSGVYIPSAGVLSVLVELVGGGGGGGGSGPCSSGAAGGAGGGGGGYARRMFSASEIGSSQTVTIGAGGIGGDASGTKGGDGSTTAFGSILSASGGGGGQGNVERFASCGAFGGWGGTGSNGDINIVGSSGGVAYWNSIYGFAGSGGASQLSGSIVANSICGGTNVGAMGLLYGGGGGGGGNANVGAAGGHGASGVVIITEFITGVTSAENELQQDMAILRTQLSQLNQTVESIATNPGSESNIFSLNASLTNFMVNTQLQQSQVNNQFVTINGLLDTLNASIQSVQSSPVTSPVHVVLTNPISTIAINSGSFPIPVPYTSVDSSSGDYTPYMDLTHLLSTNSVILYAGHSYTLIGDTYVQFSGLASSAHLCFANAATGVCLGTQQGIIVSYNYGSGYTGHSQNIYSFTPTHNITVRQQFTLIDNFPLQFNSVFSFWSIQAWTNQSATSETEANLLDSMTRLTQQVANLSIELQESVTTNTNSINTLNSNMTSLLTSITSSQQPLGQLLNDMQLNVTMLNTRIGNAELILSSSLQVLVGAAHSTNAFSQTWSGATMAPLVIPGLTVNLQLTANDIFVVVLTATYISTDQVMSYALSYPTGCTNLFAVSGSSCDPSNLNTQTCIPFAVGHKLSPIVGASVTYLFQAGPSVTPSTPIELTAIYWSDTTGGQPCQYSACTNQVVRPSITAWKVGRI